MAKSHRRDRLLLSDWFAGCANGFGCGSFREAIEMDRDANRFAKSSVSREQATTTGAPHAMEAGSKDLSLTSCECNRPVDIWVLHFKFIADALDISGCPH